MDKSAGAAGGVTLLTLQILMIAIPIGVFFVGREMLTTVFGISDDNAIMIACVGVIISLVLTIPRIAQALVRRYEQEKEDGKTQDEKKKE